MRRWPERPASRRGSIKRRRLISHVGRVLIQRRRSPRQWHCSASSALAPTSRSRLFGRGAPSRSPSWRHSKPPEGIIPYRYWCRVFHVRFSKTCGKSRIFCRAACCCLAARTTPSISRDASTAFQFTRITDGLRRAGSPTGRRWDFLVLCYTVNDPARARLVLDWGVDSVISDTPSALAESVG